MEVVAYQLLIVATICIGYWHSPRSGLLVSALWTAETLILLFFPPLIFVQLLVVWGTYFVLRSFASKSRLITMLRDQDANLREQIRALGSSELETLEGRKHADLLRDAVDSARESLCLLSGWISDAVFNRPMIDALDAAIRRGVNVYIGYGYRYRGENQHRPEAERALAALRGPHARASARAGRLYVANFATPEKLLIQDTDLLACGSYNWLSTSGSENRETSVVVRRKDLARQQRDRTEARHGELDRSLTC